MRSEVDTPNGIVHGTSHEQRTVSRDRKSSGGIRREMKASERCWQIGRDNAVRAARRIYGHDPT
jgi:hypothetical protein